MSRSCALRWLLAGFLLAACSSETEGEPPRSCLATRDCRAGERCTNSTCVKRAVQACASDTECGSFSACVEAVCIGGTACQAAADCGTGESCDSTIGMCVRATCDDKGRCPNGGACDYASNKCGPRRACTKHEDCQPPNGTCDGGYCTSGCGKLGCSGALTCQQTTGRCGTGDGGCTSDAACGAPVNVCESSRCVPGCGSAGCSGGQTCNTATGRCGGTSGCASDAACGAPTNICEGGQCIPGCGSAGCSGGLTCDNATGRCGGSSGCASDAACGAPTNICEGGRCIAGCLANGCGAGMACNPNTGRCETGSSGPADIPCTKNTDCATNFCLVPATPGVTTGYCSQLCSRSSNCPPQTRCWEPPEAKGLKACLNENHLMGSTVGTKLPGQRCTAPDGSDCKSGICAGETPVCAEGCSRDGDCNLGEHCRAYNAGGSYFIQACISDLRNPYTDEEYPGPVPPGSPGRCDDEFLGSFCASWFCAVGVDQQSQQVAATYCFSPCCSSAECGPGSVCQPMFPYFPAGNVQSSTLMKGCWPAAANSGNDPVGAACSLSDGLNCRSNLCIGNKADGSTSPAYCSDYCCQSSDCPSGFACVATTDEASGYSFSLCAKL